MSLYLVHRTNWGHFQDRIGNILIRLLERYRFSVRRPRNEYQVNKTLEIYISAASSKNTCHFTLDQD